jgi:DNA damage-binding protein 1
MFDACVLRSIEMAHEIGCLSINPLGTSDRAALAAVGLWGDMSVRIVKVPSLEEITREVLEPGIIPRSVMLITFEGIHYLFAALGDGSLFTFGFDPVRDTTTFPAPWSAPH